MNKLCKYVETKVDNIIKESRYSGLVSWFLITTGDRILSYTFYSFMGTDSYIAIDTHYRSCRYKQADHLSNNEERMDTVRMAYYCYLKTLLPHQLEQAFTEHELMELFSDE